MILRYDSAATPAGRQVGSAAIAICHVAARRQRAYVADAAISMLPDAIYAAIFAMLMPPLL